MILLYFTCERESCEPMFFSRFFFFYFFSPNFREKYTIYVISFYECSQEDYKKELQLLSAITIIERLESKFGRSFEYIIIKPGESFNNTTLKPGKSSNPTIIKYGESIRKPKWTYIFKTYKNEPAIKFILDEIHSNDTSTNSEEKFINDVSSTAEYFAKTEKKFVAEIAKTASYLHSEKHRGIFARKKHMRLIFTEDVPEVVVNTSTLLAKAYFKFIDKIISE